MTDDDLTPHELADLASAYLDGDAPADGRARVDASAELTGLVQSFRAVREQLADVPPAAESVREAAFAAALAEYDLAEYDPAEYDAPSAATSPVVSLASRRRWPDIVMKVAAAVAVVGIIGVVAFNNGSDDKDSTANKDERMSDMATADSTAMNESAGGSPTSTIGSIEGGVTVAQVIETPADLLKLAPGTTMAAPDTTVVTDGADSTEAGSEPDVGETLPEIAAPTAAPAAMQCLSDTQLFLADIFFENQYAIAAIDTVTGVITAIADDCSVLASVGS